MTNTEPVKNSPSALCTSSEKPSEVLTKRKLHKAYNKKVGFKFFSIFSMTDHLSSDQAFLGKNNTNGNK